MLHRLLQRQLKKVGATSDAPPPDLKSWQLLLERVSTAYHENDQDRYTLERSISLSSTEVRTLYSQIQQDRDRLHALMRLLDEGVCAFDLQGQITHVNAATQRVLGLDEETLLGASIEQVIAIDPAVEPCEVLTTASSPGGAVAWLHGDAMPQRADGRIRRPDDSTCDVSCSLSRVHTDGRIVGGVLTLHDITNRKAIEEAIRQSEQRLMLHVQRTPLPAIELTSDGIITRWNRAAEKLFGFSEAEALGRHVIDLIVSDHMREQAFAGFEENKKRTNSNSVHENITRDGKVVTCEWYSTVLVDAKGETIGIAALAHDITDRLHYEEQLRQAKVAAEESSRTKTNFLANMSHEIRTPMTAILGFTDLLEDANIDQQTRSETIETIRRNGEHLLNVINDILDIAKVEENMVTMECIPCPVRELIEGVASLMRIRAESKSLVLTVSITSNVPQIILTDPTRLRQILTNVVSNAIKFTERGSVRIEVETSSADGVELLQVRVIDTGIGMEKEHLEHIFEPFAQADTSTTRRFGGTGLGLAISRTFARMLGGDVFIESQTGKGSTTTICIQCTEVVKDATETQSQEQKPSLQTDSLRGRILLAEDGPDNQRLISVLLRKRGADVVVVPNGQEAMEIVQQSLHGPEAFDLVLMDMQMPVMDGYTATRQLRNAGCTIPIVALTAHAMTSDRQRCISAGCDDYMTKPMKPAELYAMCARYLPKSQQQAA